MRDKRAGRRAAGDRVQHGRFDLKKIPFGQPFAHGGHNRDTPAKRFQHLRVRNHVEITLAVPCFNVRQAVVLFGQRPQRLRQQFIARRENRYLAPARTLDLSRDADVIANIEIVQGVIGLIANVLLAEPGPGSPRSHRAGRRRRSCRDCATPPPGPRGSRRPVRLRGRLLPSRRTRRPRAPPDCGGSLEGVLIRVVSAGAYPFQLVDAVLDQVLFG